jgi:hypothetical protein
MFSFTQLEQLSLKILRSRAWAMRDQVGADRLPPVPQNNEAIVMWILDTQTAISRVVGQEYTIYDFGYPKHGLPTVDGSFFDPQPAMGELPHEYPPARRAKRAPLPCPQARNVRRYATSVRQFQVRTPPPTRRWSAPSTRLLPLATLPRKGRAAPASSERPLSACIACKRGGAAGRLPWRQRSAHSRPMHRAFAWVFRARALGSACRARGSCMLPGPDE